MAAATKKRAKSAPKAAACCPPATKVKRPKSEAAANKRLAELAKALAHPARIAILRMLTRRTECVCGDIVAELPLAQSTVSQHLKILKEAGLIRGTVFGPSVCYCVEPSVLDLFKQLTAEL